MATMTMESGEGNTPRRVNKRSSPFSSRSEKKAMLERIRTSPKAKPATSVAGQVDEFCNLGKALAQYGHGFTHTNLPPIHT